MYDRVMHDNQKNMLKSLFKSNAGLGLPITSQEEFEKDCKLADLDAATVEKMVISNSHQETPRRFKPKRRGRYPFLFGKMHPSHPAHVSPVAP